MSEVNIRKMVEGDRNAVIDFFNNMGPETRGFFNRDNGNFKNVLAYLEGTKDDLVYFIAERNNEMLGMVFFFYWQKKVPWLGIAVGENVKGTGVGTALMKYAKDYATEHNKGGILLTTHVANLRGQVLYEHSGYERMGIHTSGEILYMLNFEEA